MEAGLTPEPGRMDAEELIAGLALLPHPEGGRFREVFRHVSADGGRGDITSIYYLLRNGERSHWHRVDATEIWYFHGGAALELLVSTDGVKIESHRLGVGTGLTPQAVVPAGAWQAARSLGDWCLVGCAVAPAFEFLGFEMAPPGWSPGVGGGRD